MITMETNNYYDEKLKSRTETAGYSIYLMAVSIITLTILFALS